MKFQFVLEVGHNIDSVHVFDDLDVSAGAGECITASAVKVHVTWVCSFYAFLLFLCCSHFVLHNSLNLKLCDLIIKQKSINKTE